MDRADPRRPPRLYQLGQFEPTRRCWLANAQARGSDRAAGPAREGPALLQGLAICGRCGRRMTVRYHQRRDTLVPDYQCVDETSNAAATLPAAPGPRIDRAIEPTAPRHRHPPRARGRAQRPSRARHPRRARPTSSAAPRRTSPPSRRRSPAAATSPSTPTTVSSPTPSKPTGTTRCAQLRAAQDEYDRSRRRHRRHRRTEDENPGAGHRLPGPVADPATPQRERKRMLRLLIEDVTIDRADDPPPRPLQRRPDHQPHQPHPAQRPGKPARPTPTPHARSTSSSTPTPTPRPPTSQPAGHHSGTGQPFTGRSSQTSAGTTTSQPAHRLRARGKLTIAEIAQRLAVHPTIKAWHRAGLLTSHKADDRTPGSSTRPSRRSPHRQTPRQQPQTSSSHPTSNRRCSMKRSPCPNRSPTAPRGEHAVVVEDLRVVTGGVLRCRRRCGPRARSQRRAAGSRAPSAARRGRGRCACGRRAASRRSCGENTSITKLKYTGPSQQRRYVKSPTHSRFGALGGEVPVDQIRRRCAVGSVIVVRHGFPRRFAPRIPCARISRCTWQRGAVSPARRSAFHVRR